MPTSGISIAERAAFQASLSTTTEWDNYVSTEPGAQPRGLGSCGNDCGMFIKGAGSSDSAYAGTRDRQTVNVTGALVYMKAVTSRESGITLRRKPGDLIRHS
jgi:hypothetical protein